MLFPVTIFLGAFLLFQVQPMMGRFVLPWFGGGPAVWTTCMLFFQTALLAGYAYAHWLSSRRGTKLAAWIHNALLAASVALLPIAPNAQRWKPALSRQAVSENPSGHILLLLAATVGAPYFLLSSTTPLLQRWFHNARPNDSPWRLYALSNAGSFLALFSYPFLVEPWLRLRTQSAIWSACYVIFAALCAGTARKFGEPPASPVEAAPQATSPENWVPPAPLDVLMWLSLAAVASVLLLATTSQISQEVAVIPFLWIAPLAVYLFTFILTFESGRWYRRGLFAVLAGVLAPVTCAVVAATNGIPIFTQIAVDLGGLFAVCMVCHGELARSRPSPKYLTAFYLTIAAGGALGGAFAALVAPRIFTELDEYPLALSAGCILGFVCWIRGGAFAQWTSRNFAVRIPLMALLIGGATSLAAVTAIAQNSVAARRNFYGILRVSEGTDRNGPLRQLTHGRIKHGFEYLDQEKRDRPTSYYGPHSGVALAIDAMPKPRRVAIVGLGAGTLAAWGRTGDTYRFYEINPAVEGVARQWFYFLKDSRAHTTDVVLGDARVQLERELAAGRSHDYDVIAVDAFSSDSIPIHLLTAECADLYRQRLAPGGILALHISNRSLDLQPVARGMAQHLGWRARMVIALKDDALGEDTSRWVLLTEELETFQNSKIRDTIFGWSAPGQPAITWTDDFASLWHVLRFN
ncbi:MAG TPA: fused MFS/spermidine synthase [Bryobacteraceae bacterium]|nr:fused MFS/spermidine synthase [Bryobacteraceae bacterium]